VNLIFLIDMKYVIANTQLVQKIIPVATMARRQSPDGKIMLNEKDITGIPGETFIEKLTTIDGIEITESQAIEKINKEIWK